MGRRRQTYLTSTGPIPRDHRGPVPDHNPLDVGTRPRNEWRMVAAMDWPVIGFWVGLLIPAVSYLLYPLAVVGLGRLVRSSRLNVDGPWPDLTVAIAAHNEEATIERAVRSVLDQEYPGPRVSVSVGLDGCTDRTLGVLQAMQDPRLTILDLPRAGKAATDNRLVAAAQSDVVVTTSAGSEFAPGALADLAGPFRDPRVGCVTGVFRPRPGSTDAEQGEGLYWRFEYLVMNAESRLGLLAMASGTALAFRRALFRPIPADSDADVVVAPTVALLGSRVVHVPSAVVFDDGPATLEAVLRSRRRMALRALPATLDLVPRLLAAGRFGAAFGLIAHKVFRWLTPAAGVLWVISAGALIAAPNPTYAPVIIGLVVGAALLFAVGLAYRRTRGAIASLALAQLAFSLALFDVIRGRRARMWTRQPE